MRVPLDRCRTSPPRGCRSRTATCAGVGPDTRGTAKCRAERGRGGADGSRAVGELSIREGKAPERKAAWKVMQELDGSCHTDIDFLRRAADRSIFIPAVRPSQYRRYAAHKSRTDAPACHHAAPLRMRVNRREQQPKTGVSAHHPKISTDWDGDSEVDLRRRRSSRAA
ncbi:hypothetical protein MSAN_00301100 [Mycena sanguinolenta]|uniref:Uncharacterized protein n=1 Tax=Mycena sanguinolenta TaxID=230812 RepID=A0A8H6ZAV2_9AGAR|nr:hypothetical protein MSAN_00301100 [Mycena sanguinolenta]